MLTFVFAKSLLEGCKRSVRAPGCAKGRIVPNRTGEGPHAVFQDVLYVYRIEKIKKRCTFKDAKSKFIAFSCETVPLDISLSAWSPLPPVLVLALLVRDLCGAPRGLGASRHGPTMLAAGCPSQPPEGNLLKK